MDQVPDRLQLLMFGVAGIILIMIFSALLSAAEKAVDAVNKNDIRSLAEEGNIKAKKLARILEKPSDFMVTSKAIVIFFGMLTELLVFRMTDISLVRISKKFDISFAHEAVIVLFIIITACVFTVLCIIYPRQIAVKHPESVALKLAGFSLFFAALFKPFVMLDQGLASLLLIITRQGKLVREEEFSEEEVMSSD